MDFRDGFSVITGETGAGKSILLGAIELLLGNRADTKIIAPSSDRCVVEGEFSKLPPRLQEIFDRYDLPYDSDHCIIRREISRKGRSRSFVNDSPAPLNALKEISEQLIDIHSQHKNLLLGDLQFQLEVLDAYAHNNDLLNAYSNAYSQLLHFRKALALMQKNAEEAERDKDYLQFQWQQLHDAQIKADELELLQDEQKQLSHAVEIKEGLVHALDSLGNEERGACIALKRATDALSTIERYYPASEQYLQRIKEVYIELDDIRSDFDKLSDTITFDPQRLDELTQRLDLLQGLLHKHKAQELSELIELCMSFEDRLLQIGAYDEEIALLSNNLKKQELLCADRAKQLHQSRKKAANEMAPALAKALKSLGMPHIQFEIALEELSDFGPLGSDRATFLFSANKQMPLCPVAEIASGGEVARLMLCLKALIADRLQLPSIVFDEIDTGVSGDIADRMGSIMKSMASQMQVIAITHLPQIAAKGTEHYFVYKEEGDDATQTQIRQLNCDERIEAVATMLSGSSVSDLARAAAKQLLDNEG